METSQCNHWPFRRRDDLNIETRMEGVVSVMTIIGELKLGDNHTDLRDMISESLRSPRGKVLLDLQGVTGFDWSAVPAFVFAHIWVANEGGALKLVNLPPDLLLVLHMNQLDTLFECCEDKEEALASFRQLGSTALEA